MSWKKILLLLMLIVPAAASARSLETIYKNNSAARNFNKDKALDAYEQFVILMAQEPFDPTLQFNIGASLSVLGEEAKAEALYRQLLTQVDERLSKTKDSAQIKSLLRVKFGLLYNLGVHSQAREESDSALVWYQKALEIIPDSNEIKTNIELMFAQGQGGGKGKKKDKQKGKPGEEGDEEGEDEEENQKSADQPRQNQQPKDGKKEFDQKYMSGEDLRRIMEELKQQEQGIRAKFERTGNKKANEDKSKNW